MTFCRRDLQGILLNDKNKWVEQGVLYALFIRGGCIYISASIFIKKQCKDNPQTKTEAYSRGRKVILGHRDGKFFLLDLAVCAVMTGGPL